MSDVFCVKCGHSPHEDTGAANFCFKMTDQGLCGCETYIMGWTDEPEPLGYLGDDDLTDEQPFGNGAGVGR